MARFEDARTFLDSRNIHRLCCNVGFSEVRWRRKLLFIDALNTVFSFYINSFDPYKSLCLYSGSESEGVAADFLESDIDVMIVSNGSRVIQDEYITPDTPYSIFQMIPASHIAFVKLKFRQEMLVVNAKAAVLPLYCVQTETGDYVLPNSVVQTFALALSYVLKNEFTLHGPAITVSSDRIMDIDSVFSLHCQSWPMVSKEWKHRRRQHNWPSCGFIDDITNQGCEVVGVGYPGSPTCNLEWRISSSVAEKMLIRSLNITQIQCYFLLKLILKFLIKPHVKEGLCSYHMKNIILHVVEKNNTLLWREDNLANCFMVCINGLLTFLEMGYLPQFFIPTHNLLNPKLQGSERLKVRDIVRNLQAEGWQCVLRCAPSSNEHEFCQHDISVCPCHELHWELEVVKQVLLLDMQIIMHFSLATNSINTTTSSSFLQTLTSMIDAITSVQDDSQAVYFPSSHTVEMITSYIRSHVGYMLLNVTRCNISSRNTKVYAILKTAQRYLEDSCDVDMTSCRLKLATFYYMTGMTERCIKTVKDVLNRYVDDTLTVSSFLTQEGTGFHPNEDAVVSACTWPFGLNEKPSAVLRHVAFTVRFLFWELWCIPPAIREIALTQCLATPEQRSTFPVLEIDPLVYAHYLLVISYKDIGRLRDARESLADLRHVVQNHWRLMLHFPERANQLVEACERICR